MSRNNSINKKFSINDVEVHALETRPGPGGVDVVRFREAGVKRERYTWMQLPAAFFMKVAKPIDVDAVQVNSA